MVHRTTTGIYVVFDTDGNVIGFNTPFGDLPSIVQMKGIITYAEGFIEEHGTQDAVDYINFKNREAERIEMEQEQREERMRRYLEKNDIMPERGCDVYLIKDTLRDVYKVGMSANFDSRFKQIKTANAGVERVAVYRGCPSDEKTIHSVYDSFGKRVSGEWFNLSEADIDYFHQYFAEKDLRF